MPKTEKYYLVDYYTDKVLVAPNLHAPLYDSYVIASHVAKFMSHGCTLAVIDSTEIDEQLTSVPINPGSAMVAYSMDDVTIVQDVPSPEDAKLPPASPKPQPKRKIRVRRTE